MGTVLHFLLKCVNYSGLFFSASEEHHTDLLVILNGVKTILSNSETGYGNAETTSEMEG
jgi:hypothetical protein